VVVSDAHGKVHQVLDERVQPLSLASFVFKRAGCCSVPFCTRFAANGAYTRVLDLCSLHVSAGVLLCDQVCVEV